MARIGKGVMGMAAKQSKPRRVEFFMAMRPPETTAQMRKVAVVGGRVRVYDPPEVADMKAKLRSRLAPHRPEKPLQGPVRLVAKWLFPVGRGHFDGEWRTTPPDTDNLQKALKDTMTKLRFWGDDAQVASEVAEKFWAAQPGIYVMAEELPRNAKEAER